MRRRFQTDDREPLHVDNVNIHTDVDPVNIFGHVS